MLIGSDIIELKDTLSEYDTPIQNNRYQLK